MYKFNVLYSDNQYDYEKMVFNRGKPYNLSYNVMYCDKVSLLDKVNSLTVKLEKQALIGFDTETALTNDNIDHSNERPTIIQYGDQENVIVMNVSELLLTITEEELLRRLPSLTRLLTSRKIIKVGVALIHDVTKMETMGIKMDMYSDLQWMAACLGYEEKGLNALAEKVIGSQKYATPSHNWYNVTDSMIEYAARDVILPLLAFNELFSVTYNTLLAQLIPNMDPNLSYDLFDLSCIMVNHSRHIIKSNVNIRNFIIRALNLFGLIVNMAISENYIAQEGDLYYKVSDISSVIEKYDNPVQYRPFGRDDYPNATSEDMGKLDYYEKQQRIRLLLPEENTIIAELLSRSKTKKDPVISTYPTTLESIKLSKMFPQLSDSAAQIISLYNSYLDARALLSNLPCRPIGGDKNNKIMYESAINRAYKSIVNILSGYSLTLTDVGMSVLPIEEKKVTCLEPVPYSQQISLDDIIGMIPKSVIPSDINSFVLNVVSVQDSLRYLLNLPENPTKKDNTLINENKNKYNSNMDKLKNRVKRFKLSPDLFLRLPEPIKLE